MGSAWDTFIEATIANNGLHKSLPARFTDEVDIMYRLANSEICAKLLSWLRNLPRVLPIGPDMSNDLRAKGNKLFKENRDPIVVLAAYNTAIAAAPKGSRAMALGYANRAIILIRVGRYREAFYDCQLALDGDYPEELRLKVYFRQAECVESLDEPSKLGPIIEGISKANDTKELSENGQAKLQMLKAKYAAAEKCTVGITQTASEPESRYEASLKVVDSPTQGRHVIANEAIEVNDIIATETAFSFVPVYEPNARNTLASNDCQKCARVNVIPFVCATCGRACYCSPQCRENHQSVHRFECYGYQKRLWFSIGIAHLGIRCLLDGFDTIRNEILKANSATACYKRLLEMTSGEENELGDYGKVFRLVTNFKKMDKDDVLRYALAGLMLSIYLIDCTDFVSVHGLSRDDTMSASDLRVLLGALIMRHIGQLVCNGHAISELRASVRFDYTLTRAEENLLPPVILLHRYLHSSRVFTAIFPRISMFNHDCDPNIRNHFDRATLKVYATRSIPAGSEIVNCYGPHYRLMPVETRLMHLHQQYCFDCNCTRCRTGDDTYLKQFNTIRCPRCRHNFSMELNLEDFMSSFRYDFQGQPTACPECFQQLGTELYRYLSNSRFDMLEHSSSDFKRVIKHYDYCSSLLVDSNQTKATILQNILDSYTQYAGLMEAESFFTLRDYCLEFVTMRRNQFGFMSMEYLTACFYLLDIWAEYYRHVGDEGVTLKPEELTALNEFRAALSMVGEDTRALISAYMKQNVILDEETPYDCWVPLL
ncbi:SET and MYND domain-containing protein 4-like [Anopheles moucheti]|uniref:SET and MYND domain-containing protein 4-like n=1 Tax=Anopheles moucheti TaxID=186751 RepID=UPI0022F05C66|nr:SET and MYND domain-containing protein 4-like [Anopheles moucheti]